MKILMAALIVGFLSCHTAGATTISVVPIFEPLSLHGTDVDEAISDTGEALQACVMSRPMAMTGAFPEVLVDAIRSTHPGLPLLAETDNDAVDFYRALGFTVEPRPPDRRWPGRPRYRCTLAASSA